MLLLLLAAGMAAQIRRVPQDYRTIQSAIHAAGDGDTVLVSEGRYKENIRYLGKAITVASLYIIDGDRGHIRRTVIDGSNPSHPDSGSVVSFVDGEDTTSVLCGFTLTGGSGTRYFFDHPAIISAWLRSGGGIFCHESGARISGNEIARNRVVSPLSTGGGIEALGSPSHTPFVIFEKNVVRANSVQCDSAIEGGQGGGGDFSGVEFRISGNVFEMNSIVGRNSAFGAGLAACGFRTVGPWVKGTVAGNTIRLNVAKAAQESAVGAGVIIGYTSEVTVRDNIFERNMALTDSPLGWATGGGLYIYDGAMTEDRRKYILNNKFLHNSIDCSIENDGGGLTVSQSLVLISGNEFAGNTCVRPNGGGAALFALRCSFWMENNIVYQNRSAWNGGGVLVFGAPSAGGEQVIVNNTFVNNYASNEGNALMVHSAPNLWVFNNIFWNNSVGSRVSEISVNGSVAGVQHCNVKGGYPGTGNVSVEPKFRNREFRLSDASYCIGKGIDSVQNGTVWVRAPAKDFYGILRPNPSMSRPDLGAIEHVSPNDFGASVSPSHAYVSPKNGTVRIFATVADAAEVLVSARIRTGDREVSTLPLFDDGLHGDGFANDRLFANIWSSREEQTYFVDVTMQMPDTRSRSPFELKDLDFFTTVGPIAVDSLIFVQDQTPNPGDSILVKLVLRNRGSAAEAKSVQAHLTAADSWVSSITEYSPSYGDIGPGSEAGTAGYYRLMVDHDCPLGTEIRLNVTISSLGRPLWYDTTDFRVNLPWWRSSWAYAGYAVLVFGSFFGGFRYVETKRLKKKILLLEREKALEQERARISRDLHDEVGASLTEISILTELAKKNLDGVRVSQISDRASDVTESIKEIIWATNPENDSLEMFLTHIVQHVTEYLAQTHIMPDIRIPRDIPDSRLSPQVRRNLFLVVKEAIHNLVKYAEATAVVVEICTNDGKLEIRISDNGIGFLPGEVRGSGNGLKNMRRRLEDVGGTFRIDSRPGAGTSIIIAASTTAQGE